MGEDDMDDDITRMLVPQADDILDTSPPAAKKPKKSKISKVGSRFLVKAFEIYLKKK